MLNNVNIRTAYTYSGFSYGDFKKGTADFSGKKLPGVPEHTLAALADVEFKHGIYFNSTWYYATRLFLDDANAVETNAYNVLGCRIGWKPVIKAKLKINLYAGVENLLDETYSLGNDINAAGGRYYNAAPNRNFYAGVSFQWNYSQKK